MIYWGNESNRFNDSNLIKTWVQYCCSVTFCFYLCRAPQLRTSPRQPGGVSGPKCRVQVWGPWRPSSHRALEERRWWPAQRKVWLTDWSSFITQYLPTSPSPCLFLFLCLLLSVVSWRTLPCVQSFCVFDNIWYMWTCFNPDMRFAKTTPWRSVAWPQRMSAPTPAWQRTWWARRRRRPRSPSTVIQNTVSAWPNISFTAPCTAILNSFPLLGYCAAWFKCNLAQPHCDNSPQL